MAANKGKKVVRKRRERKNVERGQVHIRSSFNNTMVTVTDAQGNALSWASSGGLGFRGSRKSTPFAAQTAAETAAKAAAVSSPDDVQTGPAVRDDRSVCAAHEAMLAADPLRQKIYKDITESIWETSKRT